MKRNDFVKYAAMLGITGGIADAFASEPPSRRPVIPIEVIKGMNMHPATERTFTVRGDDNQDYSLDDVLRVLFDLTRQHWQQKK